MGRIVGLTFVEAKHVCPHCGKEYKSAEALAKHMKDKHAEGGDPSPGE